MRGRWACMGMIAWVCWFTGPVAWAAEVSVAVAANFAAPMKRLAVAFEHASGHRTVVSVGATGALYAQAVHGAPFEVFLGADQATAQRLQSQGLAVQGSAYTYAIGRLVLWSAQPDLVDPQGEVLRTARFQRLALANPKLAPYGAAAYEVLHRKGLLEAWRHRLVQGDNIAQAHQFTASKNAALGFLALSQVVVDGRLTHGSAWVVPSDLHSPLKQDMVLLKRGANAPAAYAFMEFMRSPAARAIIRAHGYED